MMLMRDRIYYKGFKFKIAIIPNYARDETMMCIEMVESNRGKRLRFSSVIEHPFEVENSILEVANELIYEHTHVTEFDKLDSKTKRSRWLI